MTPWQRMIVRMALTYARANLDDVCKAFAVSDPLDNRIEFEGEVRCAPTENDINEILEMEA